MPLKSSSSDKPKRNTMSGISYTCTIPPKKLHGFQGRQASQAKLKIDGGDQSAGGEELDSWIKSRQLLRPEDQVDLTEAELNEEISKVLTVENTNVVKNLVIYSFTEGGYVPLAPAGNTVSLFNFEGTALHLESQEAQDQLLEMGEDGILEPPKPKEDKAKAAAAPEKAEDDEDVEGEGDAAEEEPAEAAEQGDPGEQEHEEEEEVQQAAPPPPPPSGKKRKLINQFNFCERAALTFNNASRTVETQTIPPPRSTFGGNVLQWVIYDSYAEDFAQLQAKEKEKDKRPGGVKKDDSKRKSDKNQAAEELNRKYLQCWQILERMINQNIFDDIAQDYRYWEDPSDEFREEEGTLLPLWKFSYEKTKKMNVTDVCFNTLYYDLFAVCFGSLDFMKQNAEGSVCLFTIKNPSFPDFRRMYDGNVAVYNLQINGKDPVYMSQGVNGKHAECVWGIKWGPDMPDGEVNFYSISADGKVFNWVLMQNKLAITTIISLFLERENVGGPDGTEIKLKGCGTSMIFHPTQPEIFLVGTEEGLIYKCSTAYSSKYLMTYYAHYLSVYRIDFNKYNSNIFASCSGDWRVKVWEDMRSEPLFIFDLGASVGDVKWAPYSSTVFAAVTSEGKVFVFDLNVNKYKAICIQSVVPKKRNKLTRLAFNQKLPFIIVGDDKGTTTSLKLSPNLRLVVKPPKKQQYLDQHTLQCQKLEKLLSLVRELPEGEEIKDSGTSEAS